MACKNTRKYDEFEGGTRLSITALGYLALYAYGIFKALFDRPIFGLYVYIFAFYLHAPARWWGKSLPDLRWSLLAAVITLAAIFIRSNDAKKIWLDFIENKFFLMFVLYVFLQGFWAINLNIHKEYMFLAAKFLVLIFIIQNAVRTEDDIKGFVLVNLLGCAYFGYLGMTTHAGGRLEGLGTSGLESANQLGQHISVILVFSCYLLLCNIGKLRYFLIPLVIMALNTVFLTESRGVLVGMAGAGVAAIFMIPPHAKKLFIFYVSLAAIAGSVLIGPQIIERFESMLQGENDDYDTQDRSAESRMVIINAQIEMFSASPLLGYGHRGTLLLSNEYIPQEFHTKNKDGGSARASHNFLMALLVDHGLIGTVLYLLVIGSCWLRVWRLHRSTNADDDSFLPTLAIGLSLSLICLMVAGLGSNNKKLEIDIWLYALIPLVCNMAYRVKAEAAKNKDLLGESAPNKAI